MSVAWEGDDRAEDREAPPPGPANDLKAPLVILIVIGSAFLLGLTILALSMALG